MSNRQKLKRIGRLIELRGRERDRAHGELATAQRATEVATLAVAAADRRWNDEAASDEAAAPNSVHEFGLRRMHLLSLRREVDLAKERREVALNAERLKLEAATHAQRELRKMEIWRESETERQRVESELADQHVTDEMAARIVQSLTPNR